MPFYRFGDMVMLEKIPAAFWPFFISDWFARSDSIAGWNTQQVPITGWNPVSTIPPAQSVKFPAGFAPEHVWNATNSSNRILLWKHVFIAGVPRNAVIYMAHTGQYQLYINGTLTAGDTTGIYTKGVCDSLAGMAKLFKGGDNDIAVYVRTEDSLSRGIALAFSFLIDTTEHFTPDPAYAQFSGYSPVQDEAVQPKPPVAPASVQAGAQRTQNAAPVAGTMRDTAELKAAPPAAVDTLSASHTDTLTSQKHTVPAVQTPVVPEKVPAAVDTTPVSHTDTLTSRTPVVSAVLTQEVPKTVPAAVDTASIAHTDTLQTQKPVVIAPQQKAPVETYTSHEAIQQAIATYNETAKKNQTACIQEQTVVSDLHSKLNKLDLQMKRIRDEMTAMKQVQTNR